MYNYSEFYNASSITSVRLFIWLHQHRSIADNWSIRWNKEHGRKATGIIFKNIVWVNNLPAF